MGSWTHRIVAVEGTNQCTCGSTKLTVKDGRLKCSVARKKHRYRSVEQKRERRKRYRKLHKDKFREKKKKYKQRKHPLGPCCEICGSTKNLCWDHDHETEKHRGTLCRTCNFGLGLFKDKKPLLAKAIEYLSK